MAARCSQQVLVQEQGGRATNALGWHARHPAVVVPRRGHARPDRAVRDPGHQGREEECYAITEEGAGSDVDAIVATARRDGDELRARRRQVARHLVQPRRLRLLPGQADRRPPRRRARHVPRRPPGRRGPVVRTPAYTHTISHHHPIVAFERGPGPRLPDGRRRGRRHGLRLRVVPVRADHGGVAVPRRRGPPDRRDHRVRQGRASSTAARSPSSAPCRPCWPTA